LKLYILEYYKFLPISSLMPHLNEVCPKIKAHPHCQIFGTDICGFAGGRRSVHSGEFKQGSIPFVTLVKISCSFPILSLFQV
jgi:hypothetical protein